jgi:hypothetical protein
MERLPEDDSSSISLFHAPLPKGYEVQICRETVSEKASKTSDKTEASTATEKTIEKLKKEVFTSKIE